MSNSSPTFGGRDGLVEKVLVRLSVKTPSTLTSVTTRQRGETTFERN